MQYSPILTASAKKTIPAFAFPAGAGINASRLVSPEKTYCALQGKRV